MSASAAGGRTNVQHRHGHHNNGTLFKCVPRTFAFFALSTLVHFTLLLLAIDEEEPMHSRETKFKQYGHTSCSYQVPEPEQLVLAVPLLMHAFPATSARPPPYRVARRARQRRHFRRDVAQRRDFRPLRIRLHFDPASIGPLPVGKQLFINSSLLPQAIDYWQKSLFVRPANAPIRLSRKCESNQYYSDQSSAFLRCVTRCKPSTNCGEVTVPDEHLYQCRFCLQSNPLSCIPAGPPDGPGVPDADFLLYVSAVPTQRCQNEDTIAYAAHCQQEAELDRPIAGHVNICPAALSTHAHDQEVLVSTVKHEILHALGFSAGLYAFFRDPHGRPRSKRNVNNNRPLSFNRERDYYDPDPSTVRTVIREDWWTAEGKIPHPVHLMVTERVREEARWHFGCDRLEGAELENQGGDGTALTHWEKRLFENEAMTGTHTQNPVYSRLTLALMEDSGWYRANYSLAEHLHWGHGLGCAFSTQSCGQWIREKLERNESAAPFCADIKHDGSRSLATTRCTDQRDSLALCNLVPYKKPLPVDYRNFAQLRGVRHEGVRHYGGSVELADFCPYNQEFEWRTMNASDRRDSRCELSGNGPPDDGNAVLELYGHGSRCFDLPMNWTERKCGRTRTYAQFMAGCYTFVCAGGRLHIRLHNTTRLYTCYGPGQRIQIRRMVDGWLREGQIVCPPCDELCPAAHGESRSAPESVLLTDIRELPHPLHHPLPHPQHHHPFILLHHPTAHPPSTSEDVLPPLPQHYSAGSGTNGTSAGGKCLPPFEPPFPDVGDPPLDEPCAALRRFSPILIWPIISLFISVRFCQCNCALLPFKR